MRLRFVALSLLLAGAPALAAGHQATIHRDGYGVPHIYGRKDADVVFGLAYAMAEDNFWQLEEDYIRALGRAAEVYGPEALAGDVQFRLWRVEERARKLYQEAPKDIRALCDGFAAGYNHFLKLHPERKPRLLDQLEGWQVLAFQDSSPNLTAGGLRWEDVRREFPFLEPAPAREQSEGPEAAEGSNMWAVSAARSASGNPMLFCNPHVGFFGGGQRYEAHLESRQGLHVSGFAILGTPYIRSGFSQNHGWCHTNNNADLVDVYSVIYDKPRDPVAYRFAGGYLRGERWTGTIRVRYPDGMRPLAVSFRSTRHGPVAGVRDGRALAVKSTSEAASPLALMTQRLAMARADRLDRFQAVMGRRAITGSNTLYVDRRNDLYYLHGNAIPKRPPGLDWTRPVDGSDPKAEWLGLYEMAELPQFVNPTSGFLQNCNSTPVLAAGEPGSGLEYPADFVPEVDNYRAKRSRQMLAGTQKFTFAEWSRMALDTRVYLADREKAHIALEFRRLRENEPERARRIEELVREIERWDEVSRIDSVAMTLFMACFLTRPDRAGDTAFVTPERLEAVKGELERDFGTWRVGWGELNRMQRVHSSGRLEPFADSKPSLPVPGAPGPVGIVFNFYASQPPGQKLLYGRSGNSYVAVVEFAKKLQAGSLLVFGQSADPASPHFIDQAPLYSGQRFKPVPFDRGDVKEHTKSTVTISD